MKQQCPRWKENIEWNPVRNDQFDCENVSWNNFDEKKVIRRTKPEDRFRKLKFIEFSNVKTRKFSGQNIWTSQNFWLKNDSPPFRISVDSDCKKKLRCDLYCETKLIWVYSKWNGSYDDGSMSRRKQNSRISFLFSDFNVSENKYFLRFINSFQWKNSIRNQKILFSISITESLFRTKFFWLV